ncbi:anaphase promoting complex subunit CDC27 KNAG_0B02240 [Huiozyma naganishii CBS 8797]|uniref:Uncharacterized protein n=1 Tax=Huiozyma naganishii (strain ATCC MYA-139 / BCRC 22969 / CBS 8797 / KCTC 17520 / NBRC 10181 / NCYC 3082 / Yp74L-3) TaxID=1071383 RepID=J7S4M3_HUIN7|nr:hypothetical protein KNAG_0B02240 [Kazachstania naganishii CBS 8797]CCK68666.1 hypothetical protein KNAG_0B02240 [Kazachstania naganishii CBS 8797]
MLFPSNLHKRTTSPRMRRQQSGQDTNQVLSKNDIQVPEGYYNGYSPLNELITELKGSVELSLQNMNFETAVFLSELYHTECAGLPISNPYRIESIYLYALSLYLNNEYQTACLITEKMRNVHIGIAYIYSRCALKLEKNEESACLHLVMRLPEFEKDQSFDFFFMPDLATIHCLIGKLYGSFYDDKASINHHIEALKLNPYLWESYTSLFNAKVSIDLKTLFFSASEQGANAKFDGRQTYINKSDAKKGMYTHASGNVSYPRSQAHSNSGTFKSTTARSQQHQQPLGYDKTAGIVDTANFTLPAVKQPKVGSLARYNNRNKIVTTPPSKLFASADAKMAFKTPKNVSHPSHTLGSSARRKYNLGESLTSTNTYSHMNKLGNPNARSLIDVNQFRANNSEEVAFTSNSGSSSAFKDLFYTFTKVLKRSSQFNSHNAIRIMNDQLPAHILNNMPWCQAQMGKLHYEISNYGIVAEILPELTKFPTYENEGPGNFFQLLLWHLRDKFTLFNLSDELMNSFPEAPETWCVVGNYFSLIKDHGEAIKAFEKATSLDRKFAYAYTLQGHEHAANETYDTAKIMYRKAIACDPQHYNAYYGLGDCASRLGKYDKALLYFEKARVINPVNAILICCCGHSLEKLNLPDQALTYYELAEKLQPEMTIPKYKKAQLLFSLGKFSSAMYIFESLTKLSPEEVTVHFMLGQIYQTMGRKKDAIKEYTIALNLDPMGNQVIIDALQKCHIQE